MLVINLAPIDQSGRSLAIAQYLKRKKHTVSLVSYSGTRKHFIRPDENKLNISYIFNIVSKGKVFSYRELLLLVKLLYITVISIYYLIKYKISLRLNKETDHSVNCTFYSTGGTVIFVVPPTITVVLPLVVAKLLKIRVVIDWHRISEGYLEIFDRYIAQFSDNITVTQEMQKYFISHNIKKVFLLTDIRLRKILNRKAQKSKQKVSRKKFLNYLSNKYSEYTDKIRSITSAQRIGVCSTSCSKEENINEFLKNLKSLTLPQGGVLFITTKEKINFSLETLQIIQVFLDYNDYLDLLTIADFGISTHICRYDFPLKIIDYLESGLTVLAHGSTPNIVQKKKKMIKYSDNNTLIQSLSKLYTGESNRVLIKDKKYE